MERERLACSVVVFFREMEGNIDPSSSVYAGGGGLLRSTVAGSSFREGSLLQIHLRWLLVAEASKAPRCGLGTWCSFGLRLLGSICVKFGVVVVKVGLGHCG